MKQNFIKLLLFLLAVMLQMTLYAQRTNKKHVHVNGYTRSDGTYIKPHYRTAPNSTNRDNFSTSGNTNPYTGQSGWITPDNKPLTTPETNSNPSTSTYKTEVNYTELTKQSSTDYKLTYDDYVRSQEKIRLEKKFKIERLNDEILSIRKFIEKIIAGQTVYDVKSIPNFEKQIADKEREIEELKK